MQPHDFQTQKERQTRINTGFGALFVLAGAEGKTHPVSKRICGGLSFARKRVFKLFFPSLAVFLFNPIYLLFQLFVYETCRGLYLIKHRYGSFFFTRVQVGIGVPRHFDFGVSQPSRHLLNVDSHVGEQGGVGMAKIVYAYPFDTR